MVLMLSVFIITTCCMINGRFLPGQVPLLRINKKVLDSQKLIVGDYKVLVWHFPSLAVFCPRALAIWSFRVCSGRRLPHSNLWSQAVWWWVTRATHLFSSPGTWHQGDRWLRTRRHSWAVSPGDFLASCCSGDCRGQPCWGHWWGRSPLQTLSSTHNK